MASEDALTANDSISPPALDGDGAGELLHLNAVDLAQAICSGRIGAVQAVQAYLDNFDKVEDVVQAWAHFDPERALEQAREADEARAEGRPIGALHGVPVGVKDIFDTKDFPTEDGTVLHAGRQPTDDATVVARLRSAGAVIMGKTVTTELAVYAPGKTRNPHDPARTPGGSSSGSAAAVASYMAPLAVGTQTNGSVIRPASFCGVVGFKPSHGLISRHRILQQSRPLDQVGVFGHSVEDVALLADALAGFDEQDPDTQPRATPAFLSTAREDPPVMPQIAFVRTPVWDQAEDSTQEAFEELVEHLGENVEEVNLTPHFDQAVMLHQNIMEADLARSFEQEYERGKDQMSPILSEMIERGRKVLAFDYNEAIGAADLMNRLLAEVFHKYDAIITPATTGEAPVGLESTGSPVFCTLWTLCGVPAITLPLMTGPAGMPLGVQLVGPRGDDARLLRTGRWLTREILE